MGKLIQKMNYIPYTIRISLNFSNSRLSINLQGKNHKNIRYYPHFHVILIRCKKLFNGYYFIRNYYFLYAYVLTHANKK